MKHLNLTHYLMLALFITILLLLRQCKETSSVTDKLLNLKSTTKSDTTITYITGVTDTIHDTVPRWYPKLIPFYLKDTVLPDGNVSLYETSIEDSLISGKFTSTVKGELLFSDFKYTAKFPKYIFRTDTFKININTEKTIVKNPWEFYIGGVVGGNNERFGLQPAALIRLPNKNLILGYGYDVINQTHNAHIYTKIR